jgi:hypothetical protein
VLGPSTQAPSRRDVAWLLVGVTGLSACITLVFLAAFSAAHARMTRLPDPKVTPATLLPVLPPMELVSAADWPFRADYHQPGWYARRPRRYSSAFAAMSSGDAPRGSFPFGQ